MCTTIAGSWLLSNTLYSKTPGLIGEIADSRLGQRKKVGLKIMMFKNEEKKKTQEVAFRGFY